MAYEILKFKNKIKAGSLSFIIMLTNMALLWVSWFVLCGIAPYKTELAGFVCYTGLALTVAGVVIFLTALFTIKTLESYEGDMISRGIYSILRHPMYLGFIFWLIGFPAFSGSVSLYALSVIFTANILFWRHLEEIELEHRFKGYKEYRKTTIF